MRFSILAASLIIVAPVMAAAGALLLRQNNNGTRSAGKGRENPKETNVSVT